MKNKFFSKVKLLTVTAFVTAVLTSVLFTACHPGVWLEIGSLNGTWESQYGESYTVNIHDLTFDAGSNSYAGNDLHVEYTDDARTEGYIYFKYTRAYEETYTDPNDPSWTLSEYWMNSSYDIKYTDPKDPSYTHYCSWYRYSSSAPDCGKWYAVAFKNLTKESVEFSGAYKAGGLSSAETLEKAKSVFTVENGYFAYYSELILK